MQIASKGLVPEAKGLLSEMIKCPKEIKPLLKIVAGEKWNSIIVENWATAEKIYGLAKKLNTDGWHLGQKDMNINEARKILKNKIIGITCHNSIKLAKIAIDNNADYIAFGAFNDSKTKKARYKAKINILLSIKKMTNIPVVAIGGINSKNYKKLILNKANFLAISGYIWNNKKYKPSEAIEKIK